MEKFTVTQAERIGELNGSKELIEAEFETKAERDQAFRKAEKELVRGTHFRCPFCSQQTKSAGSACHDNDFSFTIIFLNIIAFICFQVHLPPVEIFSVCHDPQLCYTNYKFLYYNKYIHKE